MHSIWFLSLTTDNGGKTRNLTKKRILNLQLMGSLSASLFIPSCKQLFCRFPVLSFFQLQFA